jgi:glycosyltransferase involved in cell wall biosynthesis
VKVLLVSSYFPPSGGGLELYVERLAESLTLLPRTSVTVLTGRWPSSLDPQEEYAGFQVRRVPIRFRVSNTPIDPAWVFNLKSVVREIAPDVIVVNVPVVGLSNAVAAVSGDIPVVVVLHAATNLKKGHAAFNIVARLYEATAGAWLLRQATRILAVSSYVQEAVPDRWQGKALTVNTGVPITPLDSPPRYSRRFVFLGQLERAHSWKGLEQIIEACALCRSAGTPVELIVGGDGNDRDRYESMVERLRLGEFVTFRGWIGADERRLLLASATATVLYPTTANDALPLVILESWEAGTAVIVSKIGALPSIVRHGSDALLVEPDNPKLLAEELMRLAENTQQADELGQAGRRRVTTDFNWAVQCKEIEGLLRSLSIEHHTRHGIRHD